MVRPALRRGRVVRRAAAAAAYGGGGLTVLGGFWLLTDAIRNSSLATIFIRLEPYAFFLFCSHAILFNFGGIVFRRAFGNYGSDLFPITFFTLPFIAVLCAIVGLQIIGRSRTLLFLFNAGHGAPALRRERSRKEEISTRRIAFKPD